MTRTPRILPLFVFSLIAIAGTSAQQPQPAQMASLRPNPELRWQRTSPTPQEPEGPVLYQLLFNASGTPGAVPAFDTDPCHPHQLDNGENG
ncbi:MAG TPA: hypothetical protein VK699_08490 [Terriglobales bacterium]|jgi:hypothetical protein|nr:hypothetical protein [Terriglobales bacterium]